MSATCEDWCCEAATATVATVKIPAEPIVTHPTLDHSQAQSWPQIEHHDRDVTV